MDLKVNFNESNKLKLLSLETFSLDKLKNKIPNKIKSTLQNISSGEPLSSTVVVIASESDISFYHSANQSLEVLNFSPYFKVIIHESTKRALVFENKGEDPVTIHSINFSQNFFSCPNKIFPITLEEGEQKKVEVSFLPRESGIFNCVLTIKTSVLNYTEISYQLIGYGKYNHSYYKIINGLRYDRELFNKAHDLLHKNSQDIFSLNDAQHLVLFAADAHRFTSAEKSTLQYVAETFNCSDEAKKWLTNDRLMRTTKISDYQISLYILSTKDLLGNPYAISLKEIAENEFGLKDIEISVLEEEAKNQNENPKNKFMLQDAFRKGLLSFLEDDSDIESPRNLIKEREPSLEKNKFSSDESYQGAVRERLLFHMNQGKIRLLYESDDRDIAGAGGPEGGESRKENWVFHLTLYSFSDHLYWVVVNRSDGRAVNYGFN